MTPNNRLGTLSVMTLRTMVTDRDDRLRYGHSFRLHRRQHSWHPVGWQLIDMSFGVLGVIPLIFAYRHTQRLATPAAPRIVPDTGVEALPGRAQL